jgi:quercetin dioxygenase-like cupin family protein
MGKLARTKAAFNIVIWLLPVPFFAQTAALHESDQTQVLLTRVEPHQTTKLADSPALVVVALDPAAISSGAYEKPKKTLNAGDFLWFPGGTDLGRVYQNHSDKDARFIEILFPQAK